jgi:BNR/Asp-box repeat
LAGDKRIQYVGLGCGMLILIALVALSTGRWGTGRLEGEVHRLESEIGELKWSVEAHASSIKQLQQKQDNQQGMRTVTFPDPDQSGFPPYEPHIAVDPDNPERLLVSVMHPGQVGKGDDSRGDSLLVAWNSEDGGRSWSKPTAPFGNLDRPMGRLGADGVVTFGLGKTCWFSGCDYDWHTRKPNYSSIKVSLSEDGGKKWQRPIAVTELDNDKHGKGTVDKQWLAVDRSQGKHRGTLYVAWSRWDEDKSYEELRCAAMPAGSQQFAASVPLGEPIHLPGEGGNPVHQVQLAVRPDGALDVVWRVAPSGRMVHAFSRDGGASFSKPVPIAQDEGSGVGQFPSLSATPDGKLLAAWSQDNGTVLCSVLTAGRWSPPRPLTSAGAVLTHPAVAATVGSLWVLVYRDEGHPKRVSVVLYRSTDYGKTWKEDQVIASRMLAGGPPRGFSPGDYVGLAAAEGTVCAAFILPGDDSREAKPQLYVTVLGPTKEQ